MRYLTEPVTTRCPYFDALEVSRAISHLNRYSAPRKFSCTVPEHGRQFRSEDTREHAEGSVPAQIRQRNPRRRRCRFISGLLVLSAFNPEHLTANTINNL